MALTILIVTALFCAVSVALGIAYGRSTAKTTQADLAALASLKAEKETVDRERARIQERLKTVGAAFDQCIESLHFIEKVYQEAGEEEAKADLPAYLKDRIAALESLSRGWEPLPDATWLASLPQDEEMISEEVARARKELEEVRGAVQTLRNEHEEAQRALKHTQDVLAEAREGIAVLESHRNELIGEIVLANQQREQASGEGTVPTETAALRQRISELEAQLARYRTADTAEAQAAASREKSLAQAEERLRILGEAIRTAEERLREVVHETHRQKPLLREEEIRAAQERLSALEEAVSTSETKLQSTLAEVKQQEARLRSIDVQAAENRLLSLFEAIRNAERDLADRNEQLAAALHVQDEQEEATLRASIEALQQRLASLNREVESRETALKTLNVEAVEQRLLSLFEAIRNAERDLADRNEQLAAALQSSVADEKEEAALRASIDLLKRRVADLTQEAESREAALKTLNVPAAEARLRDLRAAIALAEEDAEDRAMATDTPEWHEISTRLESRKAELEATERELAGKYKALEAWNARAEAMQHTLDQHLETRKAAQEAVLQELAEQSAEEQERLQDELDTLRLETELTRKAQEKARAQAADLEAILAEKQEDLAHLTRTLSQRESTLSLLRNEISALRHEVVQSRTEYQSTEEAVQNLKTSLTALDAQKADLTRSLTALEVEKKALLDTVLALKQEAQQYETSMQSIRQYVDYVQQREAEVTKREQEVREREALVRRNALPDPARPTPAQDRPRFVRLGQRNF